MTPTQSADPHTMALLPAGLPTPPGQAEVEALGERIAELAAQITAATYELLVMLREFDERGGWGEGFRSCAHWLNWRTGLDLGAAREKVRVASALPGLPVLAAAMRRGELSYSKVRALTRMATPDNEAELLIFAQAGTASQVEKLMRSWRRVNRWAENEHEQRRHAGRYLRTYTDEDGMVVLQARLAPEAGAVLLKALDAAGQKLFAESKAATAPGLAPLHRGSTLRDATGDTTAEQRRADAIGLVAESALSAGLDPGTRGDRYQVVLHVDAEALGAAPGDVSAETSPQSMEARPTPDRPQRRADTAQPCAEGRSTLDGTYVSAETSRRLTCDCALVKMTHENDGNVLDVGRRTRILSPALRRALTSRDEGCRFPGCGLRLCDAHHVEHWADGGSTRLGNLVSLCRFHHRAVHEGGFRVELLETGEVQVFRPNGRRLDEAPALPTVPPRPLVALAERLEARGALPPTPAMAPSWDGGPVDYGWSIEFLRSITH
jgi:hypothetical protein